MVSVRTCVDCGVYKYIEANGLCRKCYENTRNVNKNSNNKNYTGNNNINNNINNSDNKSDIYNYKNECVIDKIRGCCSNYKIIITPFNGEYIKSECDSCGETKKFIID